MNLLPPEKITLAWTARHIVSKSWRFTGKGSTFWMLLKDAYVTQWNGAGMRRRTASWTASITLTGGRYNCATYSRQGRATVLNKSIETASPAPHERISWQRFKKLDIGLLQVERRPSGPMQKPRYSQDRTTLIQDHAGTRSRMSLETLVLEKFQQGIKAHLRQCI